MQTQGLMGNTQLNKVWLILIFIFTAVLSFSTENAVILSIFITIYGVFTFVNFVNQTVKRLPLGELAALIFFIENCFSLSILFLNKEKLSNQVGDSFYCLIPEYDFLLFSFLASQAFLIGYYVVINKNDNTWKEFIQEKIFELSTKKLNMIIAISFLSNIVLFSNISSLYQVSYFLNKLLLCSLFAFIFSSKRIKLSYLIIGLSMVGFTFIRSGMMGELIYFSLYFSLLLFLKFKTTNYKTLFTVYGFLFISFIVLILMQNSKAEYRKNLWFGNQSTSSNTFSDILKNEIDEYEIFSLDSYTHTLYRLNQGYLVSAAMTKVPSQVPFVDGETILSALKNSFVPRALDPNKEEAGGREKIARFTNIILVGSTSMNIGLLGESYVNFGKNGAILFIFLFGMLLARFELAVLKYGQKNTMVIVMFPIFFSALIGSGGDFLMLFNTIVKGSIFIYFILMIVPDVKK